MRYIKFVVMLFFIVLAFGDGVNSQYSIPTTVWHGLYIYFYNDAKKISKKTHKPVLLYFYGNDCTYCDLFDKYVLEKPDVVDFLNRYFVFVSINIDNNGNHIFVRKFNLFGTPAFAVLYPNHKFVVYQGYKTKEQFLYILNKLK